MVTYFVGYEIDLRTTWTILLVFHLMAARGLVYQRRLLIMEGVGNLWERVWVRDLSCCDLLVVSCVASRRVIRDVMMLL